MSPERAFRINHVKPFLKALRFTYIIPIQQVAIRGIPDFLLCCRGKFIAMELKSLTGRLSKIQRHVLQQITNAQGVSLVVNPDNWENAKKYLLKLDQGEYPDV